MAKTLRLTTYEEPEEYARRGCQWHEENDGTLRTHKDVLINKLGMKDPYAINKASLLMEKLTAKDGEFEHLTRIIHRTARNRPRPPNTWARDFIAKNFIKQPIRIVVNDINGLALIAHFS